MYEHNMLSIYVYMHMHMIIVVSMSSMVEDRGSYKIVSEQKYVPLWCCRACWVVSAEICSSMVLSEVLGGV